MGDQSSQQALARACLDCHNKKIRCDLPEGKSPCSNCQLYGTECRPRARKRKYDSVQAPVRDAQISQRYDTPARASSINRSARTQHSTPQEPESRRVISSPIQTRNGILHDTLTSPTAAQSLTRSGSMRTGASQHATTADTPKTNHTNEGTYEDLPSQPPNSSSFIDLSSYYGRDILVSHNASAGHKYGRGQLTQADMNILDTYKAFQLPSSAWMQSLIENFMGHCQPWMPIVEREWLEQSKDYMPSMLLLKAVFVAGAQINDPTLMADQCKEHYVAARALFICGFEQNPIMNIVAAMLLCWSNTGVSPERVSMDSSSNWHQVAVGIAYQIGLHKEPGDGKIGQYRRRLWWTLVVRDSQICAGHGKPRAINLAKCTVKPLSVRDFPVRNKSTLFFLAIVHISVIVGDICESRQEGDIDEDKRRHIRNALFWWLKTVPTDLKIFAPEKQMVASADNLLARQLYVVYLTGLTILYRTSEPRSPRPTLSILASSFLVQLFEGFLARDEIRYLSSAFVFYAISAAIPQLSACRCHVIRHEAVCAIGIIELSLESLARRCPAATPALKLLRDWKSSVVENDALDSGRPDELDSDELLLLDDFNLETCPQWKALATSKLVKNALHTAQVNPGVASDIQLEARPMSIQESLADPSLEVQFSENIAQIARDSDSDAVPPLFDDFSNGGLQASWDGAGVVGGWLFDDQNFDFNL